MILSLRIHLKIQVLKKLLLQQLPLLIHPRVGLEVGNLKTFFHHQLFIGG